MWKWPDGAQLSRNCIFVLLFFYFFNDIRHVFTSARLLSHTFSMGEHSVSYSGGCTRQAQRTRPMKKGDEGRGREEKTWRVLFWLHRAAYRRGLSHKIADNPTLTRFFTEKTVSHTNSLDSLLWACLSLTHAINSELIEFVCPLFCTYVRLKARLRPQNSGNIWEIFDFSVKNRWLISIFFTLRFL